MTSGTFGRRCRRASRWLSLTPQHAAVGTTLAADLKGTKSRRKVVKLPFYKRMTIYCESQIMANTARQLSVPGVHEWHRLDGDTVTIGITQIAADELTDVTYVALPKVGTKVQANQRFGEIESVKATSDLYSGVSGEVTEVNGELANSPGLVNNDPYEAGWMIKLKAKRPQRNGQAAFCR